MSEFKSEPAVDPEDAAGDDGDNGPVVEEESTATFSPIVQLEIVEVKTHEEDEDIVYKQRAKLFLFGETMLDKGSGNKTWKERGIGDVKLLRHKETGRIRVLMRQEKTMKVIINHFLDPRIVLVPNAGSDKSWVWNAFDFADNQLVETTFALRFGSPEVAGEFKGAFTSAQAEMTTLLAGKDTAEASKESEDVARALENLEVKAPNVDESPSA